MWYPRLSIFLITMRTTIMFLALCESAYCSAQNSLSAPLIIPSVMQGGCSVCGTSSCINCPKLSSVLRASEDQDSQLCRACKNRGEFCTDQSVACFIDPRASRGVCAGRSSCCMENLPPYTAFIPRSQGTNTARELVGWEEFIHQYDVGEWYLTTGHVLGYYRSFHGERIAREIFGERVLRFSGSQVALRGRCELLADNFGLSPTLRGTVTVDPVIENIVWDNQFFFGLDPLRCGLYLRVHMPFVYTRWDLNLSQTIEEGTCSEFPACYMADDGVPAQCDIIKALRGHHTFGEMQTPWKYGRIINGVQTKIGLADIDLILGYDAYQTDSSHFGIYGQLALPTGTKFTARQLFEPLVGNARHLEVGMGISGHLVLVENDIHTNLALYIEGNVVHMCENTQMRSFDFCNNGPLSRYMLLKELTDTEGELTYAGSLINGINFATRQVSVSIPVKGDISAKLCVRTPHMIADLGYNFYGRTAEHVCFKKTVDQRLYAIKGTEGICGLEYTTNGMEFGTFVGDVPLNSSQSHATIRRGAPTDNPQPAPVSNPSDIVVTPFSRQEGSVEGPDVLHAFISVPPKILSVADLHKASGTSPSQATHKVFGYVGYNFFDCDTYANPYLGIGGEIEFDALNCEERSSLNQWSIWVKGGFEF